VDDTPLHPFVAQLAPLLGVWRGTGHGSYPTVAPFDYTEESTFWHVGRPLLGYLQKTRRVDGPPSHTESGYWRMSEEGGLDVILAHATGVTEIEVGEVTLTANGVIVTMASVSVVSAPAAKDVRALERRLEVDGDTLRYSLAMAAVGQPLTHHLAAELHRVA
jgi:hypothetical protein